MNFNLQFSILAMTITALLSGHTLAAAEGSQTNRRLRGNNQQRVLVVPTNTSTNAPSPQPTDNLTDAPTSSPSAPTANGAPPSLFCPEYNPGSNTACSLTGVYEGTWYEGTCYYSSSAKNAAEAINTDAQACSCNANQLGKFDCTGIPVPN